MARRKIRDYHSFEFPGVEKEKFEAWQKAEVVLRRIQIGVLLYIILGNLILIPTIGVAIKGPGLIIIIIWSVFIIRAYRKRKAAGITSEMLKNARNRA